MLGGEIVRAQRLDNVCSTSHLFELEDGDSIKAIEKELTGTMRIRVSAIMVVGSHQHTIRAVLAKWAKRKAGMRAVNCGKVTRTGTLWKISRFN